MTAGCTLRVGVCFYFQSDAEVSNSDPTYKAYAYDLFQPNYNGTSGGGFKNTTEAATVSWRFDPQKTSRIQTKLTHDTKANAAGWWVRRVLRERQGS